MNERISIRTLTDGGQQPLEIAHAVAAFLDGAERTLELAQYDFNLGAETAPGGHRRDPARGRPRGRGAVRLQRRLARCPSPCLLRPKPMRC